MTGSKIVKGTDIHQYPQDFQYLHNGNIMEGLYSSKEGSSLVIHHPIFYPSSYN